MARVKRGTIHTKKRRKILKATKGFRWGRKSKIKLAKQALLKAWSNAFVGRKLKKRDYRKLWQTKIKAAANKEGLSYSKFINLLKKHNIALNRKSLADIAENYPDQFKEIVSLVKKER